MNKSPTAKEYLAQLGEALPEILPPGFERQDSATPRFRRRKQGRTEDAGVHLLSKYWPSGTLVLSFGVSYDEFDEVFSRFVENLGLAVPHIYHDTINIHQMQGLEYLPRLKFMESALAGRPTNLGDWPCSRNESPLKAIRRTEDAITGVLEPFWSRFSDIEQAWLSLRDNDGWTSQGWCHRTVLAFGTFLGDADGVSRAKARLTKSCGEEGVAVVETYLHELQDYVAAKRNAQQDAP
jgi:hypothetical protein